jgi:hypothetical protein
LPRFAAFVVQPAAIVDAAQRVEFANQIIPAPLLLNPFVRIGGIAQDEKVEAFKLAGFFQGFIRRAQTFADAHDVFVVNREDNCRADARDALAAIFPQARDAAVVAEHPQHKTIQAVHATDGGKQKQNHEQNQQHGARRGPAGPPQQIGKEHRDQTGKQQRAGIKDEQPPATRDAGRGHHPQGR